MTIYQKNLYKQYTTNKIKFIKVGDFEYSNNDYRFFCFRDFLQDNEFDVVFHNDASDVTVVKDPIELIEQNPNVDYFRMQRQHQAQPISIPQGASRI